MSEQATSLATPDPLLTSEGLVTAVVAAVADVYVLFGSNLTNEKQTALATVITTAWLIFSLAHSAYVRGSRAKGGGLVGALITELPAPVAGSDPPTG